MVSPFDIKEIFEDTGPALLPQRRAGSTSQGLAVTLMAEALRWSAGRWSVPSSAAGWWVPSWPV